LTSDPYFLLFPQNPIFQSQNRNMSIGSAIPEIKSKSKRSFFEPIRIEVLLEVKTFVLIYGVRHPFNHFITQVGIKVRVYIVFLKKSVSKLSNFRIGKLNGIVAYKIKVLAIQHLITGKVKIQPTIHY